MENVINTCLRRIVSTKVGKLLINQINKHISYGSKVIINNYAVHNNFQYPHSKYSRNVCNIIIPDTPYFVQVQVFNEKLIEGFEDELFYKIINCEPIDEKLNRDFCSCFSTFQFQPIVVVLFHELVHCLRYFEDKRCSNLLEEEATIYGIEDKTLIINGIYITENTFRKELV